MGLAGCLGAMAFLMIAKAMRQLELSTVLPILSLEPGLVALLAFLLLGESLSRTNALGLLLILGGAYILELRVHGGAPARPERGPKLLQPLARLAQGRRGHFALLGLLFYGFASLVDRYMLVRVEVTTYLFYTTTFITAIYLVLFFLTTDQVQVFQRGSRRIILLILVIAALHLTANVAQAKAISLAAVGLVIAIKRLSALIDILIGGRFFHEHNLGQKALASIVILTGVFFIIFE